MLKMSKTCNRLEFLFQLLMLIDVSILTLNIISIQPILYVLYSYVHPLIGIKFNKETKLELIYYNMIKTTS